MIYSQNRFDALMINFETSTGDVIDFEFSRTKSSKFDVKNGKIIENSYFSTFEFYISSTNGLNDNDRKEIKYFMRNEAKPFIDEFLNSKFNLEDKIRTHNTISDITNLLLKKSDGDSDSLEVMKSNFKDNLEVSFQNFIYNDSNGTDSFNRFDKLEEMIKETIKIMEHIFENVSKIIENTPVKNDNLDELIENNLFLDLYI